MLLPKCRDAHRGPGRPRQFDLAEREAIILDTAERIILERGLAATSMAAIAKEAGMSKRTLYEVFESRATLFASIVRRIRTRKMRPLADEQHGLPLAQRLRLLLTPSQEKFSDPLPMAILRAVIAESERQPDLAQQFLQEGPYALYAMIRTELDRSVARGEIAIADTEEAARLLVDMAHTNLLEHLVLVTGSCQEDVDMLRKRVDLAIRVFHHGIAERAVA
ncbi:TetR/AcrR family transcriptional regulator [Agrobacterium sp. ES01]|uniref:TetR/AcrR family transcriptional regulator n=1 Tax=Agrobacterium sp. ES01 TaxID=3420714 RepID=UPI003D0BB651